MEYRRTNSKCEDCPFRDRNRVWGQTNNETQNELSTIAFIGEAPGRYEDLKKKPFVGGAGQWLWRAIKEAGFSEFSRTIWLTNRLSCRPDDNRVDTYEASLAFKACRPGFLDEINYLVDSGVKVFIPLGSTALKSFGILDISITRARGNIYERFISKKNISSKASPGSRKILVVPTYHPSYIMRTGGKEKDVWVADMVKAKKTADEGYTRITEDFNLFPTLEDLQVFTRRHRDEQTLLGVDIETTSLVPWHGDIVVIGLATGNTSGISVPFYKKHGEKYFKPHEELEVRRLLNELFSACPTIFQNALFDVPFLEYHGIRVPMVKHDVLLAHHAIHPELPHNLGYIVSLYGSTPEWKQEFKGRAGTIFDMEDSTLRTYNLRDSVVLHQVLPGLLSDLKESGTLHIYETYSIPLIYPLKDMFLHGLPVSRHKLKQWLVELEEKISNLKESLYSEYDLHPEFKFSGDYLRLLLYGDVANQFKKASEEYETYFEPGSKKKKNTKKFAKINALKTIRDGTPCLTEGLKLQFTIPRTDGGSYATNTEALESLHYAASKRSAELANLKRKTDGHYQEERTIKRLIQFLETYRELAKNEKLESVYRNLPIGPDGRVHAAYKIHGTVTGRFSSGGDDAGGSDAEKFNGQNLPPSAKAVFIAPPGYTFIDADASNLELRVLALIADDDVLQSVFDNGLNAHDENTKVFFKIEENHPEWETYRKASKTTIFSQNYGATIPGTYRKIMAAVPGLKLTLEDFKKAMDRYMKAHPKYRTWRADVISRVSRTRTIRNAFGRIRIFLSDINKAQREALNFPIQSTAADIINTIILSLYSELKEKYNYTILIGTVHDSVICLAKDEHVSEVLDIVKKNMEQIFTINNKRVSIPCEIKVGKSLGSMEKIKEDAYA